MHYALVSKKHTEIYDVRPDNARGLIDVNRKSNPETFGTYIFLVGHSKRLSVASGTMVLSAHSGLPLNKQAPYW